MPENSGIVCYNRKTGEIIEFSTPAELRKHFSNTKTGVKDILKKGKSIQSYQLLYLDPSQRRQNMRDLYDRRLNKIKEFHAMLDGNKKSIGNINIEIDRLRDNIKDFIIVEKHCQHPGYEEYCDSWYKLRQDLKQYRVEKLQVQKKNLVEAYTEYCTKHNIPMTDKFTQVGKTTGRGIILMDTKTGDYKCYPSVDATAKALKITPDHCGDLIRKGHRCGEYFIYYTYAESRDETNEKVHDHMRKAQKWRHKYNYFTYLKGYFMAEQICKKHGMTLSEFRDFMKSEE